MSTQRPIDVRLHPIETGDYRVATPAIQAFYELATRCLRYRIPGALVYGPPRIGKTRAIEYLRLLLAETYPRSPRTTPKPNTSRAMPRGHSLRTCSKRSATRSRIPALTLPSAYA